MSSIRIITAKVHYQKEENDVVDTVEDAFIASSEPYYLGLALRPSPGLWEFLKSGKAPSIESESGVVQYSVEFSIDVGENTMFFLSPAKD